MHASAYWFKSLSIPPDLLGARPRRLIGPAPNLKWTRALGAHATEVAQLSVQDRWALDRPS
jgi:hypothetical protein